MRKLFTLMLLVVGASVSAQLGSLPTIDDPQDADRIFTYTRGFAAAFRLDTLKSYFQEGGKFIDTVTVDATGDTLIFSFTDGTEFRLGGVQGEDGVAGADGADGAPGDDGLGWTSGTYNASTGVVTFNSDDGLGFSTGDLRGEDGDPATNYWTENSGNIYRNSRVGINRQNPAEELEVSAGGTAFPEAALFTERKTDGQGIGRFGFNGFNSSNQETKYGGLRGGIVESQAGNERGKFDFEVQDNGSFIQAMTINGRFVGIGVEDPTRRVDVDGRARIRDTNAGDAVSALGRLADGTITDAPSLITGGEINAPLGVDVRAFTHPNSAQFDGRLQFGEFYQGVYNTRYYSFDRLGYGFDLRAEINPSGDLLNAYLTLNDRSQFGGLQLTGKSLFSLSSSGFAVRGFSWEGGVFDYVFGPNAADRYELGAMQRPDDGPATLVTNKDGETEWNQAEVGYVLRFSQAVGTFPAGGWTNLNMGTVELESGGVYEFELISYHQTNNASTAEIRFIVASGNVSGRYVDGFEGQTSPLSSISQTAFTFPASSNNTSPRRDVVTGYFTASGDGFLTLQGRGVSDTATFANGTQLKIKQIR